MYEYVPVPLSEHDKLLGRNFSEKFSREMKTYYQPFVSKQRDIQIAKETWEYGVADSISNAQWVGAGKNVVDVKTPLMDIDVKGLSTTVIDKNMTTEASFLQNNKVENDGFANLFKKQDFGSLKKIFVDPLADKIKGTNNLHILAIIREKSTNDVYYTLLKVSKSTVTDHDFLAQMKPDAARSVSIPMINASFGKTYIYVPKRRLEIRLNCPGIRDYLVLSHNCKQ